MLSFILHGKAEKKTTRISFYDDDFLAENLTQIEGFFHREIKPIILADFPEILKKLKVNNPDIGLDKSNIIYLADSKHKIIVTTETNISLYI